MLLDNLAIRTKALIPVVVMALMVLMIVVVGGYQTAMLGAAANDMAFRQDRGLVAILMATRQVNRLKVTVFQSLIYDGSDISGSDKEKKAFVDARTRTDALLAEAMRLLPKHAPEISDLAKQFDGIVESAESPFNAALDTPGLANGRNTSPEDLDKLSEGARQLYHVDNASTALIDAMTALADTLSAENAAAAKDLQAKGRSGIVLLATVGFIAALIAGALSIWITSRKIALPLTRLAERMRRLADGNLETEIDNRERRDEVGQMASAVQVFKDHAIERQQLEAQAAEARAAVTAEREANARRQASAAAEREEAIQKLGIAVSKLADKKLAFRVTDRLADSYEPLRADLNSALDQLQQAFSSVAQSAAAVGNGTNEIAVAANDLSKRTEQQASSLEQSTAALNEITSRVTQAADGAREASAAVADHAPDLQERHGNGAARSRCDEADRRIVAQNRRNHRGHRRDRVPDQPARAQCRSRGGARRGLRPRIRRGGGGSARARAESRRRRQGNQGPRRPVSPGGQGRCDACFRQRQSLSQIETSVAAIDSAVSAIAADAHAQATGLAEVSAAIAHMDQMTQQNASMAEEATAASQSLATEGEQLARLIGQFAVSQVSEDSLRRQLKAVAPHAFPAKAEPAPAARTRAVTRPAVRGGAAAAAESDDWREF